MPQVLAIFCVIAWVGCGVYSYRTDVREWEVKDFEWWVVFVFKAFIGGGCVTVVLFLLILIFSAALGLYN